MDETLILNNLGPRGVVIKLPETMLKKLGVDEKHSRIQIRLKTSPNQAGIHIIDRSIHGEDGFMLCWNDGATKKQKAYIKALGPEYPRHCEPMDTSWDKLPVIAILLLDQDITLDPENMKHLDFDVRNMTRFIMSCNVIICEKKT